MFLEIMYTQKMVDDYLILSYLVLFYLQVTLIKYPSPSFWCLLPVGAPAG